MERRDPTFGPRQIPAQQADGVVSSSPQKASVVQVHRRPKAQKVARVITWLGLFLFVVAAAVFIMGAYVGLSVMWYVAAGAILPLGIIIAVTGTALIGRSLRRINGQNLCKPEGSQAASDQPSLLTTGTKYTKSTVSGYWVAGFGVVVLLSYCSIEYDRPEVRRKRNCGEQGKISAMVMSENFVERQLQSPKSAEFPSLGQYDTEVNALPNCQFKVRSYVDAQNILGVKIRSRYKAVMTYNPYTDLWTKDDLNFWSN